MPQTLTHLTNAAEDVYLSMAVTELNEAELQNNSGLGTWTAQTFAEVFCTVPGINQQGVRFQPQILAKAVAAFPVASSDNQAIVLTKLGMTGFAGCTGDALAAAFVAIGMPAYLLLSVPDQAAVIAALGLNV